MLGLFARQPVAGRCKTRLAAMIGKEAAARLADAFLRDTAARFELLQTARCLAYTPGTSAAREYLESVVEGRYQTWPQPDGDLGMRLAAFLEEGFMHSDRVVVIGTDSPSLPVQYVERAFTLLHEKDCVLGPATDGGFYLIGVRRWKPGLLDGLEWSTSRVLSQVVGRVEQHAFSLGLLPPWYDVDTWDDLCLLRGHIAAMRAAGEKDALPNTTQALSQIDRRVDRPAV